MHSIPKEKAVQEISVGRMKGSLYSALPSLSSTVLCYFAFSDFAPVDFLFVLCFLFVLTTGVRHTLGLTAAEATPSIPSRVPEEMLNR